MRPRLIPPVAFAAAALLPLAPRAQSEKAAAISRIIDEARAASVDIIVLDGPDIASAPAVAPVSLSERVIHLADRISANLQQSLVDLAAAPESLPAAVAAAAPDGTTGWLWWTVTVTVLALLIGWGIEQALARSLAGSLPAAPQAGAPRAQRIRAMFLSAGAEIVLIAVGLVIALLLTVSLAGNGPNHRTVTLAAFEVVVVVRILLLFARAVLLPGAPATPVIPVPADAAVRAYGILRAGLWGALVLAALTFWLDRIGAAPGLVTIAGLLVSLAVATTFGRTSLFLHPRLQGDRERSGGWLARNWHRLVLGYLGLAVAATALGRLAGLETSGIVIAPAAAAMLAAVIYAAALLVVDAACGEEQTLHQTAGPSFRDWAEQSALLIAVIVALCIVLGAWGVDFFRADGSVRPVYAVLLVLLMAHIGWLAIRTAFDRRIAEELATAGPAQEDGDESDTGSTGGTRLATLLPLCRNAILIAILMLVFMVMLSSIGLDIAPLFAGAGLVGIAIGFGAQTLVRDIFSGIFFLVDDAFRVGEYIETGGARGTVERISIRSMQLRHQNGPLHTIPFGEITQLTNYSRDWVIMKLPIRVRFGTDTERVRKLIKKLGQELLQHPVVGEKFVEPLKSQGVYQMDELGIVTRVKFKTKPGDQFAVRKIVYQKINELFEREGIAFGGREVVVRAIGDGQDFRASNTATEAVAAASQAGGCSSTDSPPEKP